MRSRGYWTRLRNCFTLDPRPSPLRNRRPLLKGRNALLERLEPRELLTASMQIFDGSTQLSTMGSDSFDPATVGDVAMKTFTISSVGDEDLSVNSIELPAGFSLATTLPLDVPAGDSSTFTVSMDTSMASSDDGQMEIDSNSVDSPFYLDLSGTVNPPPPALSVADGINALPNDPYGYGMSPDDFGSTPEGTPVDKTFTITNSSASDLRVSNLSLPDGFSLVGSFPATVPAGGSTTFTIELDATSISQPSGELNFSDSDPGGGGFYQFAISGTVVAPPPALSVADGMNALANDPYGYGMSPDDFGSTPEGTPVDKTFTITNSSASDLSLSNLSLPDGFTLVGSFPATVPAGGSTTFTIELAATSISQPSGELNFSDSDPGGGGFYQFAISGTVVAPPPALSVADGINALPNDPYGYGMNPDDFGSTPEGTSVDKVFTITNSSASDLSVSGLSLPDGFSLVGAFPATVPAGGSTTFTIELAAASISTPSGELNFSDADPGGGGFYQFAISGTVVAPPPVLSVLDGMMSTVANDPYGYGMSPVDFGSTPLGTPLDETFDIVNSGSADLTVGNLSLPGGFTLVGSFPTSISAHGSMPFTVEFDSAAAGTTEGELAFDNSDPGGGGFYQFAISATATVPAIELDDEGGWLSNGVTDDFGITDQGTPVQKQFTLSNTGEAPLKITPASLLLPAGFSLVGSFPTSVAAGASANFTIQLNAASPGSVGGSMSFEENDPANNPFSITLTGVVNAPSGKIAVSEDGMPVIDGQSELDFGTTDAGVPATQTLVIQNVGPVALSLSSLALPSGFEVAQTFAASVAPGASTQLVVELDSAQGGDFGGLASFSTSDPSHSTFSFFVNGEVNPPEPVLAVYEGATTLFNGDNDDFGSTALGTAVEHTWTITNQGNAPLALDTTSLTMPDGFSVATPFAANVVPGGSTTLAIELAATTGGDYSGTLDFSTNDPMNGEFSLNLTGQVLAPAMTVLDAQGNVLANNSSTLDFGGTPLGTQVSETVEIENTGAADLTLDPQSLALPAGYSLVSGFANDVPAGGSTTFTIALDATAVGDADGQVSFKDGDPNNSPFTFSLTGSVTYPQIEVLDGSTVLAGGVDDDFGTTTIGVPVERALTIENIGQAPLVLDPSSIIAPTGFSVATPFSGTVAAGGSTTLVLQLDASAAGDDFGLLTFVSNDPTTPVYKLYLHGSVLAPALDVRQSGTPLADGSSVSLGTTAVGAPLDLSLIVGNDGTGTLVLDPASLSLPAGFNVVQTFAGSVGPDGATTLVVALTAAAAGNYSGTLSFTSNDGTQNPFLLTISGVVTAPAISVLDGETSITNQGGDDLGLTPLGTAVQRTLSIENNGTADLEIDTAQITLPDGFSLVAAPAATIAPGGSSQMIVQLDAAATGDYAGSVTLPSNDPSYPSFSFTLNGRVLLAAATLGVLDGGTNLPSGGALNFPATQTGLPVSETLSLENTWLPVALA